MQTEVQETVLGVHRLSLEGTPETVDIFFLPEHVPERCWQLPTYHSLHQQLTLYLYLSMGKSQLISSCILPFEVSQPHGSVFNVLCRQHTIARLCLSASIAGIAKCFQIEEFQKISHKWYPASLSLPVGSRRLVERSWFITVYSRSMKTAGAPVAAESYPMECCPRIPFWSLYLPAQIIRNS